MGCWAAVAILAVGLLAKALISAARSSPSNLYGLSLLASVCGASAVTRAIASNAELLRMIAGAPLLPNPNMAFSCHIRFVFMANFPRAMRQFNFSHTS